MTVTTPNRVTAGVPAGGEFAPRPRAEADISLSTNWPHVPTPDQDQLHRAAKEVSRRKALGQVIFPGQLERIASRLAEQEDAYRHHLAGAAHPYDAFFQAIWDGAGGGYSKAMVEEELSHVRSVRNQLQSGIITPAALLGSDAATREQAEAWVDERETLYTEALNCGGKNLSINQASVIAAQRRTEPTPPF